MLPHALLLLLPAFLALSGCECPCAQRDAPAHAETAEPELFAQHNAPGAHASVGAFPSLDSRALSLIHAGNLEDIELGRLAEEHGHSPAVRRFGRMLVNDHAESEAALAAAAAGASVRILEPDQTRSLMAQEHGYLTPARFIDPAAPLRGLSGAAFDRAFISTVQQCHCDLIKTLETAQPGLADPQIRALVGQSIATLREHDQHAKRLTP